MRNALIKLTIAICMAIGCIFPAFAAELSIKIEAPEDFKERVEVYLDMDPHPFYHGYYDGTLEIADGTYEVVIISPTDIMDTYSYTPSLSVLDTSKDNTLTIHVKKNPVESADAEEGVWDDYVPTEEYITPSEYDFSEGKPYGTVKIRSSSYGALKSATYELVGNDTVYTITLDRDHGFWADVKLPAASYYESSTIHVELDEDAAIPNGMEFLWHHNDVANFFGKYYDVAAGSESTIDDLKIMMVYEGKVEEVDSYLLFYSTMQDNRFQAQARHVEEKLESAFPEQFTESETETIATAVPEAKENPDFPLIPLVGAAAALFVILAVATVAIRRKKQNR